MLYRLKPRLSRLQLKLPVWKPIKIMRLINNLSASFQFLFVNLMLLACSTLLLLSGCQRGSEISPRDAIFPEHPTDGELLAQAHKRSKEAQRALELRAERQRKAVEEAGIVISDADLQANIDATIKNEFSGDRAEFVKTLSGSGYTMESYKQFRRHTLAIRVLRDQIATKNDSNER